MHYLQNHCFCLDSCWGGIYNCRHVVSFNSYQPEYECDWESCIDPNAEIVVKSHLVSDAKYDKPVPNLKPEVLTWLRLNVADRKINDLYTQRQGWAIGNTEYREMDGLRFSIFSHRKSDAMAFIRYWSKWKKPTTYCQYFTDVRKKLNLETGKYIEY